MTSILAVQGDGFVVMGTDSRVSSVDDSGYAIQVGTIGQRQSKIVQNKRFLLGTAGDVRAINILAHAFSPPLPSPKMEGAKLDQFVTSQFVPSLRKTFEEHGYANPIRETSSHLAEHSSSIIMAVNCHLYVIEGDYGWTSHGVGVYGIGSGSGYGIGAIYAMHRGRPMTLVQARKAVLRGLEIAAILDPFTGGPFHLVEQNIP